MRFEDFSFGRIRVDGTVYDHDLVIDQGKIQKRKKKLSKRYRASFGHTPLSTEEKIPCTVELCPVGTGMGALPVMDEVKQEARRRGVELRILATGKATSNQRIRTRFSDSPPHLLIPKFQSRTVRTGQCE